MHPLSKHCGLWQCTGENGPRWRAGEGLAAGLFPVFPLNFLFFFKYSFVNSVVTISSPVIGQNKVDR